MKLRIVLVLMLMASLVVPSLATAGWRHLNTSDIQVDVIGEGSYRPLSQYPVEDSRRLYRGYLEAKEGREYEVRVRNRSDQHIGVVISVDGRNIISGASSNLDRDERMYVLGPYETGKYRGWRTGRSRINRFYFTDAPDSYAGRWGDYSDMGVVAVAAYTDRSDRDSINKFRRDNSESKNSKGGRIAPRRAPLGDEPGTGIGHSERSPSRIVEFEPSRKPFARVVLKYEWRETLCDLGVERCFGGYRKGQSSVHDGRGDYVRFPPDGSSWFGNWW